MSVVHPYQPMTLQKIASEEEVQAMHMKLAGKVQGKVSDGSGSVPLGIDAASPSTKGESVERLRLKWEKPKTKTATGVYTTCKRYSCAKVTVDGKTRYELYKLVPGGGWFTILNKGLDNFLQAQKLAQMDVDKGIGP